MKYTIAISVIAAAMLAFAAATSIADNGKGGGARPNATPQVDRSSDRDRTRDRSRLEIPDSTQDQDMDRLRDRDRIHAKDPMQLADADIYGSELMTVEERNQYRRKLKAAKTEKAREKFQIQHEKKMQKRAEKSGEDLVPPGQGKIYGGELMTVQERNEYREQQRRYDGGEEMQKFQAQHREKMQQRAIALGLDIEEAP
ncbi:MAG: hypothetical protein WBM80_13710 [Woeseiaceae bacterium]